MAELASTAARSTAGWEHLADEALVDRVRSGERELFAVLMRRHNRRVFRAARSIVATDDEAEDVMQDAYVRAYQHLAQFEGRSSFATWLTRIAIYEALARARRQDRFVDSEKEGEASMEQKPSDGSQPVEDLEARIMHRDLIRLVERAVDAMPEDFRTVFMLREVEGLSTHDVAESLGIREETVKTRLHRAKERVRATIAEQVDASAPETFSFHLSRCDRVIAAVMERIR